MMLKIVSPKDKYKDDNIYEDIVNYCLAAHKTPTGLIIGLNLNMEYPAADMHDLAAHFSKLKGTRIRHMVLSFDPKKEKHISHESAFLIAGKVCKYYAPDYQIFAVVHENTDHVHIHIVMNTVRIHDGEKYKGRKKDYYAFQDHLRKSIRPYGLKLEISSDN